MKSISNFLSSLLESGKVQSRVGRLLTSQIGRETLGSMGLKITSVGLIFLTTVLLARILGPAEYGVYTYVYAIISILSVPSEFGLPMLVVRETARGIAQKDYAAVQGVWRWSGWTTGTISLGIMILSGVLILFFPKLFAGTRLVTFLYGLLLVPLIALGDLRGAALRGLQRVVPGQLPEFLIRPGVFVLLLGGILLLGAVALSAPLAIGLYVIAAALSFGVGAWLLWRMTPKEVSHSKPSYQNRTWLLSALPLALADGIFIINMQASTLLQGFFLSDAQIGIFRVAMQVSQLAAFGLAAINLVIAPRFAALYAQGDMGKLQRLVTRSAQVILAFNLVITAGFVLIGKPFLRIVFGSPYTAASVPLIIMLGGQLVNSGMGSVGLLLNMTHNERETAKAMAISVVLNVVLNLIFLPIWGIVGSALATAFSLAFWNVLLWWVVKRKLNINSLAIILKRQ